jgi:predicted GTPase
VSVSSFLLRCYGLTKQDNIIKRLQDREIVVVGNPRVYKALRNQLAAVLEELQRIAAGEQIDDDLMDTIHIIAVTMSGMKAESP